MASVSIIAGQFKGRKLATPGTDQTHPMGARERSALFNMLLPYLASAQVLDTFAGSGALGLEALSRGAKHAVFIEKDHYALRTIEKNIAACQAQAQCQVVAQAVENFQSAQQFDIVFIDPPYTQYGHQTIWTIIKQILPLVNEQGIVVLSHPVGHDPIFTGFHLMKSRQYAGAVLAIYQRN